MSTTMTRCSLRLFALDAGGVLSEWDLPPAKEVDEVTQRWLSRWGPYFDELSGPEFKAKRLTVIEATFARFRALCAKNDADRERG